MKGAVKQVARVLAGLAFFGAATAFAFEAMGVPVGPGELVGVLVVDASLAAMVAILLPLPRAADALIVAALAGATGIFAFFGATLLLWADGGALIAREALLVLLGLAPLAAAAISMGGAGYLAKKVRYERTRRVA